MKPRHAAALALVGWYLMLPLRKGTAILDDAPIASWKRVDSFDSASECRDATLDFGRRAKILFGEKRRLHNGEPVEPLPVHRERRSAPRGKVE